LVRWNIEYNQFYADLCVALNFGRDQDMSYIHLGGFNLDTSPEDPSRCVTLYHDPWWIIRIDREFAAGGELIWARSLEMHRAQVISSFVWRDSHFFDQLERISLTLDKLTIDSGLGNNVDIWTLEETESRLEELEVFMRTTKDLMVNADDARSAQAVIYMLASRARAALKIRDKTWKWSMSMEEEIVRSLFHLPNKGF
jgi:hypothetical protein